MKFDTDDKEALSQLIMLTNSSNLNLFELSDYATLNKINTFAQQNWLRHSKSERWQQIEESWQINNKAEIIKQLKILGFVDKIINKKPHYRNVLLLGATEATFTIRVDYFIELIENGLTFDNIYLLGSDRKLEDFEDIKYKYIKFLSKKPETEIDMMQAIVIRKLSHIYKWQPISSKMQTRPDGTTRRANTKDTIVDFLRHNSNPQDILAISNQPHCKYQDAVIRNVIPDIEHLETVGPGMKLATTISDALDSLARYYYQILENENLML